MGGHVLRETTSRGLCGLGWGIRALTRENLWQANEEQLSTERDHLSAKLGRALEDTEAATSSFQQTEQGLMQELAALEVALRNKERELATAAAEREDVETQAVMELDSARQTLANSEKKIKEMTQRLQEQHTQIMWLDESLQKEKKKSTASGNSSPMPARRSSVVGGR
jgi:predicted RNase H-like nuclease (RuvC/YqgF family)